MKVNPDAQEGHDRLRACRAHRRGVLVTAAAAVIILGVAGVTPAYAEEIVVNARTVARLPDGLDFVEAAAIPGGFDLRKYAGQ